MKASELNKPRNYVAKNAKATTSGAGAHTDKKKSEKQGVVKHKKDLVPMESIEDRFARKVQENIDNPDFEVRRGGKSAEDLGGADAWYHRGPMPDYYGFMRGTQEFDDYHKGYRDSDEGPTGGKQWR